MAKDKLPSGIGPRTAVFLREHYPRDPAPSEHLNGSHPFNPTSDDIINILL
jgi:hypothetical protein